MTTTLFAHAGHGTTMGDSLIHYLKEPIHLAVLIFGVAATIATTLLIQQVNALRAERVRKKRIR